MSVQPTASAKARWLRRVLAALFMVIAPGEIVLGCQAMTSGRVVP